MHSTDAAYCYRRDGVVVSLSVCLSVCVLVTTTEALPVIKHEATAMLIIARWSLENSLKVRWAQGFAYRNVGILRYSRRHVIGDLRRPASA